MILQSEHARSFIDGLENLDKTIAIQATGWAKFRLKNLLRFNGLGFPTVKDEEWKYTNIEPLLTQQYHSALSPQAIEADPLKTYLGVPNWIWFLSMAHFLPIYLICADSPKEQLFQPCRRHGHCSERISKIFLKNIILPRHFFPALNLAIAGNGAFIKITDNARVEKLIHIIHLTSTQEQNTFCVRKLWLLLAKSGAASILETHISFSNDRVYFANALTTSISRKMQFRNYHKAQSESKKAFHRDDRVRQKRDSNFNSFSFMVGEILPVIIWMSFLNGWGVRAPDLMDSIVSMTHSWWITILPWITPSQWYQ